MLINSLLINKKDIQSRFLGEKIINLCEQTFQIPKSFTYQVVEITPDYIGRMDLISRNIYGTDQYGDILCKLNGISNPFELNEGDKVIIPEYDDLINFFYQETEFDDYIDDEMGKTKPKAKTKTDKRKPNEAIVGDKRYKVDTTNKVIVY